jgi:hypothetical protein
MLVRRTFLGVACACAAAPLAFAQSPPQPPAGGKYVCPPCGCSQDGKEFDKPGVCPDPACGMTLVPKTPPAPPPSL